MAEARYDDYCYTENAHQVDRPITPGDRGASTFLHGVTDEMRQEHRQRILRSTKDDVIAAVKRCAGDSGCTSSIAVIGPENMFTETGKHWLVHRDGSKKPGEDTDCTKEAEGVTEKPAMHSHKGTSHLPESEGSSGRFLLKLQDLPRDVTPAQIARHLQQAGVKVSRGAGDVLLLTDRNNQPSGIAFVQVASKEDQDKALNHMWESAKLMGREIRADVAQTKDVCRYVMTRRPAQGAQKADIASSRTILVRNLSPLCTEERLRQHLAHCEIAKVEREQLPDRAQRAAFVQFASADDARRALAMNGKALTGKKLELHLVSEDYASRLLGGDLLNLASYAEKKVLQPGKKLTGGKRVTRTLMEQKSKHTFQKVTEQQLVEALRNMEGQHKVVIENLPFSGGQIEDLLWPAKPNQVIRIQRANGSFSAKAVLSFASLADAQEVAKKDGQVIFGRQVKAHLLTPDEPSHKDEDVVAKVAASAPSAS